MNKPEITNKPEIINEILTIIDRLESGDCMLMPNAGQLAFGLDISLTWAVDGKIDFDELIDEAWEISMEMDTFLHGSPFGGMYIKREKKTPMEGLNAA